MADNHTAAIWAGGAALIAVGGIFMAVTGFEPTKEPGSVWAKAVGHIHQPPERPQVIGETSKRP